MRNFVRITKSIDLLNINCQNWKALTRNSFFLYDCSAREIKNLKKGIKIL